LGIETPIVVVPNGLEAAEFPRSIDTEAPIETPLAGNLKKDRLRLLFLGRLHPKKGLDVLLRAWVDLKSYHRHWQLVVAGPDERGYLAEVRTLARSLGVEDSVCFTGPVTGAAKNVLLRSADLFVLPSYSEGFSMSILEAMACEVPVLATRSCNFPQITEFGAGWECEPKKESLLATLSSCLAAGELERKQRGVNGCNLVRKHYNWKAIAQTLLEACAIHCS
jgi:glycosyltransferase involved in cell wall biosynthesis